MIETQVTQLPGAPNSQVDPENVFSSKFDAVVAGLQNFINQVNDFGAEVNAKALTIDAASSLVSLQNYQGVYSAAITYNDGESVLYLDNYWTCITDGTIGIAPVDGANWRYITSAAKINDKQDIRGSIIGNVTGVDLDLSTTNFFQKTVTEDTVFTLSNIPPNRAYFGMLEITNGGLFLVSFPASFNFVEGVAPVLSTGGKDILFFYTSDGGQSFHVFYQLGIA